MEIYNFLIPPFSHRALFTNSIYCCYFILTADLQWKHYYGVWTLFPTVVIVSALMANGVRGRGHAPRGPGLWPGMYTCLIEQCLSQHTDCLMLGGRSHTISGGAAATMHLGMGQFWFSGVIGVSYSLLNWHNLMPCNSCLCDLYVCSACVFFSFRMWTVFCAQIHIYFVMWLKHRCLHRSSIGFCVLLCEKKNLISCVNWHSL